MKKRGPGLTAINLINSDLPVSDFLATRLFLLLADLHRVLLPFNDSLGFLTKAFQCLGFGIAQLQIILYYSYKLQFWGIDRLEK